MKYLKRAYILEDFELMYNPEIIPVEVEPILDEGTEIKLGLYLVEEEKKE